MYSRRRFLGAGGLGLCAASAYCRPALGQVAQQLTTREDAVAAGAETQQSKNRLLGYPINMNTPSREFFQWRETLNRRGIDIFAHNNVGNPFKPSPIPYNTHDLERRTILSFAELFRFPVDNTWGFLSHSGTDSNMHGMYMGRTVLKGRTGKLPKAYFTREAHYSVQILADLLGLDHEDVATLSDGAMDPKDLAVRIARNADRPALIVATVGTTFKGAIDDLESIQTQLTGYEGYVHVDAALFGGYLPFTSDREVLSFSQGNGGFEACYDSIAVSCHKFFGFANPAGLFITGRDRYEEFNSHFSSIHNPEYIHQVPGTITCSRDATKPAEFFYYTTPGARQRQIDDAKLMLANASYLIRQLKEKFPQLGARRASRLSNTIYFRNPGQEIVDKYSLATMTLDIDGTSTRFAHVVVMPHVSRDVLAEFLYDLRG